MGFYIAGGKGRASRKTPLEIEEICDQRSIDGTPLIYSSRMSAKVDSAAVQDGYQIYHHCFFFTDQGSWAVVQQGMNEETRYARRYHWLSQGVKDFVCEPHWAVCCDQRKEALNLVALESQKARQSHRGALSREAGISDQGREAGDGTVPPGGALHSDGKDPSGEVGEEFSSVSTKIHRRILKGFWESKEWVQKRFVPSA